MTVMGLAFKKRISTHWKVERIIGSFILNNAAVTAIKKHRKFSSMWKGIVIVGT